MIKDKVETKEEPNIKEGDSINGRKVKDLRIICSKHGVINNGSYFTKYTTYKPDPNDKTKTLAVEHNNLFCVECLNEMYMYFQNMPMKNEKGEIIYQKDPEGKTILDENGNPLPEPMVGKISLSVQYEDEDNSETAEEVSTAIENADIEVKKDE